MSFFLYTLHVLTSLFLILVVLLQQGKGADLSVFGGGSTMTAFGARGAASILHKMTVIGFVLFIFTTLAIGVLQGHGGGSVMAGVAAEESAVEAAASAEDAAAAEDTGATAEDAAAASAEGEPAAEEPGGVFTDAEDPAAGDEGGETTAEPADGAGATDDGEGDGDTGNSGS